MKNLYENFSILMILSFIVWIVVTSAIYVLPACYNWLISIGLRMELSFLLTFSLGAAGFLTILHFLMYEQGEETK
jgi:hypothetical protein